ncbi:class I SAM-dependent methyltransferase [Pseudochrobactrum sp. HB0163]|uniref:class I SAM-dependent methyltransferase n=1 Tax=Pseudochrobactrum sp. HB0163 TaxID=3450708 RepID=UPI003F6DE590
MDKYLSKKTDIENKIVLKGREAISRIMSASIEQLKDRAFLLSCVQQFGIPYCDWAEISQFNNFINPTNFGIQQIPTEFTDYLLFIGQYRPKNAIEVGVLFGGVSVFTAAYLTRLCGLEEYICVDIHDNFQDFKYYSSFLPLKKSIPSTSTDFYGQSFDLAFIDADHSYDGVKKDWLNLGRFAKIAAFHDVRGREHDHLNGGVRRFWLELKASMRHSTSLMEISHHPYIDGDWMGIGLVLSDLANQSCKN